MFKVRKIKRLLLILAALLIDSVASSQELKPLRDVIISFKSEGDLAHASYFYKRCAALDLALSRLARSGSDGAATAEKLINQSANLALMSAMIEMEIEESRKVVPRTSPEKLSEIAVSAAKAISEVYFERMKKNYVLSGVYFQEDDILRGEIRMCQSPDKYLIK